MSQTIIVSNEAYARLNILRKKLGPKASFRSVIDEFLKAFCSKQDKTEIWLKMVEQELQRISIKKFYNDLLDYNIVKIFVSEGDIMTINLLLINGNWIRLDEIVHSRAEYMREALIKHEESMEVIKSHRLKNTKSKTLESVEDMSVKNAINTTGGKVKSVKSTGNLRDINLKSKKH